MRTLITGFGPFLGIADNPSARIVAHFAALASPEVTTEVLPVSFHRVSGTLPNLICREAFDVALLLGVAAREREIRLERFGRNRHSSESPDVDGFVPGSMPILPAAPDLYETLVQLEGLREHLAAQDVPVRISEDAGGYVCNHAYFTALHTIHEKAVPTRCLFVHVPPETALGLDRQIAAVKAALETLAC